MRNISFSATKDEFRRKVKCVTRRGNAAGPSWKNIHSGEHLMGVEKAQGLRKGEVVVRMGEIVTLNSRCEMLKDIIRNPVRKTVFEREWLPMSCCCRYRDGSGECHSPFNLGECCGFYECPGIHEIDLEGFPRSTSPEQFVEIFCTMNGCEPDTIINRIVFDYVGVLNHER